MSDKIMFVSSLGLFHVAIQVVPFISESCHLLADRQLDADDCFFLWLKSSVFATFPPAAIFLYYSYDMFCFGNF